MGPVAGGPDLRPTERPTSPTPHGPATRCIRRRLMTAVHAAPGGSTNAPTWCPDRWGGPTRTAAAPGDDRGPGILPAPPPGPASAEAGHPVARQAAQAAGARHPAV